jgi:6-phosphofructo-2-kinase/fructose-2,6-biphosphatase 2
LKASSGDPDYAGMTKEEAVADFKKRIAQYESIYETITEPDISFCRILNVGQMVTMNKIDSYLQSRIAFYLMNLHLKPRSIYLSRVSSTCCLGLEFQGADPYDCSMVKVCTTSEA